MGLRLTICQGLPASGKSTWAREEAARTGARVVTKDDIRRELRKTGWVWSPKAEKAVEAERDLLILDALHRGISVISADTNFAPKHQRRLETLAAQHGAEVVYKRFLTSVEECIKRDAARPDDEKVGEGVIRKMAHDYYASLDPIEVIPVSIEDIEGKMPAIICDLDGTLSIFMHQPNHRSPYDGSRCADDDVNVPVKSILEMFYKHKNYQIIYLSGRDEIFRPQTMKFLERHFCPKGPLYMRKQGDHRKDSVVKLELHDEYIRGKYDVKFCLDDRDSVVKLWRDLGYTCLQVNYGNF